MANRRHIVYLNEFFHPDICASAAVLTDQLPRVVALRPDWEVTVLTGDRAWDRPEVRHPARGEYRGVRIVRVPRAPVPAGRRSLLDRARGFFEFGRGVLQRAAELGTVDLVIGTTAPPHGGRLARRLAQRLGCPYIYRVLDLYPDIAVPLGRLSRWNPLYAAWRADDMRTMRRAAAVVTVTEPMSRRIVATRGVAAGRVSTLYDGLDPERVRPCDPAAMRSAHNPAGRFVVQYAGNMGLSHPMETIVDAARRLAGDGGVLFQFVGDGPGRAVVQQALGDAASYVDYQPAERLGDVLAMADVCLISQHDALFDLAIPYKIYASLAAARPVLFIGDARCEIAQWLAASGAGERVAHGESERLAGTIRAWKDDPAQRTAMGAAARALFDARFQVDAVAQSWVKLIENAIQSAPG